jgi:hypothetical protein
MSYEIILSATFDSLLGAWLEDFLPKFLKIVQGRRSLFSIYTKNNIPCKISIVPQFSNPSHQRLAHASVHILALVFAASNVHLHFHKFVIKIPHSITVGVKFRLCISVAHKSEHVIAPVSNFIIFIPDVLQHLKIIQPASWMHRCNWTVFLPHLEPRGTS